MRWLAAVAALGWTALAAAQADRAGTKQSYDIDSAADVDRAVAAVLAPRQPPMDTKTIAAAWKGIVADATRPVAKIIFDTDIGTDIDDAFALTFALGRPEIQVCGITTSRGEVQQRAAIVSRLLQTLGRADVPFAPGSPVRVDGTTMRDKPVDQVPFAGPLENRPVATFSDAQELFRAVITKHPGEVWLVVVGPMTNAALLIRDHPEVAKNLKGIVCMGGEPTRAHAETNITNDPAAAAIVCRSGLLKFAATEDVSIRLLVPKPDINRLRALESPAAQALVRLYELWRQTQTTKPGPVAFDASPVAWLFAPELFATVPQGWDVTPKGVTTPSSSAPPIAVTTDMNVVAVHRLLMDTVTASFPAAVRRPSP